MRKNSLFNISKFFEVLFGGGNISRLCLFGRFEKSEVPSFAVDIDHCSPTVAIFTFVNSFYSSFVIFIRSLVLFILCVRCGAQIFPAQIRRVQIFVVDLVKRKTSHHNKPCQSMSQIHTSVDSDKNIAIGASTACAFSFFAPWASIHTPLKNACLRVIVQKRFYIFSSEKIPRFWHTTLLVGGLS